MSQQKFATIEQYVGWAYRRFELEGCSLERIVDEGVGTFGPNGEFVRAFVLEAMRFFAIEAMTGAAPRVIPLPPDGASDKVSVVIEGETVERARLTRERRDRLVGLVRADEKPWARWMEKHPETGVPMRLINMTREQLLAAATVREHESVEARKRAALCRRVADRLAPGQKAREVMTEADLETIDEELDPKPTPIRALA